MLDIAVAGHLCLDLIPALGRGTDLVPGALMDVGPLTVSLGGSVANTGRALADLGATVIPSATIGADEMGTLLTAQLDAAGFTTPRLDVSATAATSYSLVVERPGEDRTF
ncbi:MAG TPA: PfkB family carbohydrate kinase, partial [Naasia sp.]